MRAEVKSRTGGLSCSAGIGPNEMLAKIASDVNKPDGQHQVAPDRSEVVSFIQALPVRKIPGVGKVTERVLEGIGVTSVAHLYENRSSPVHPESGS